MASSIHAASATVCVIGPTVSKVGLSGIKPSRLTSPSVVFTPTRPHSEDGIRTEPPVSVPMAGIASPAATATPDPLLDPPGTRWCACPTGLRGVPNDALVPHPPKANSTVCVLPSTIAPAPCSLTTAVAVWSAMRGGRDFEPYVTGRPAISNKSLMATVIPCSGPSTTPPPRSRSAACAAAIAASA